MSESTRTALLFPGQGAHTPGLRDAVLALRPDLVWLTDALVGEDVFARAADSTRFAQPAILCGALAGWEQYRRAGGETPQAFAGHSLGELGALAAAGVIGDEAAVRLAVLRGALMAESGAAAGGGSMLALLGADLATAEALAATHGVVVANDNAPGQIVLSGSLDGLEAARLAAREAGLRAIELDVAGAFHSEQMAGARDAFARALAEVEIHTPNALVLSSVTVAPFGDVRSDLAAALTGRVRWRETLEALDRDGVTHYVDTGPGRVLQKIVARMLPNASATHVDLERPVA